MALEIIGVQRRAAGQGIYGGSERLDPLVDLGVKWIRDGADWTDVEQTPGEYRFDHHQAINLQHYQDRGFSVCLNVHRTHPAYDGGARPRTPEGTAAFARWVAAMVQQYPCIKAVEIGNEPNDIGGTFWTPKDTPMEDRARALERQVIAVRQMLPDMPIVLAGMHSTAAGVFDLIRLVFPFVDALSFHPYTSEPMRFADDLRIWRDQILWDGPVWITEIGSKLPEAGFMRNWLAAASAAGVEALFAYEWANPHEDEYALYKYTSEGRGHLLEAGQEFFERDWTQPVSEIEPGVFRTADGTEIMTHPHRGKFFVWERDFLKPDRVQVITRHWPDYDDPTPMLPYGGQEMNGVPWSPYLRSRPNRQMPHATGQKLMLGNSEAEVRIPFKGYDPLSITLNGKPFGRFWFEDGGLILLIDEELPRNDFDLVIEAEAVEREETVVDGGGMSGEATFSLDAGHVILDMGDPDVEFIVDRGQADHVTVKIYPHTKGRRVTGVRSGDVVACDPSCRVVVKNWATEVYTDAGRVVFPGVDIRPMLTTVFDELGGASLMVGFEEA